MDTPRTCKRCGATIPAGTADCPRCLLELSLDPPPADPDAPAEPIVTAASTPRERPAPPTVEELAAAFPDLEIQALIGQGGMGAVYRARQRRLEREVALKVLPRALSSDRAFAERFLREARALARLSHPNIVAVHEYGETNGLCWLLLEYVDGANLREVLRAGRMEPRQALTVVRELCDALQYAHDEGVVHRDIKPENVLVDRRGRVKVTDFGLAKLVGVAQDATLTREGQVMGTPHYMAPEQIERPRDVDHRADIYALGVVLYEMLTGSLPRGKFDPPSRRVQVDVRLDEIVLKALEHEPSRRYQQAVEVRTDVDAVGESSAAPARKAAAARAKPAAPRAARPDPLRGPRGFALCLVAWIAIAALWNVGAFAFGAAIPIVLILGGVLLEARLRRHPELAADLAAEDGKRNLARVTQAVALAILGVLAIGLGHVTHWERGTSSWAPAYRGVLGLLEAWRANVWQLMPTGAGEGQPVFPRLSLLGSTSQANAGELVGFPALLLIVAGLVLLVLALHAAVRARERGPLRRTSWHVALQVGAHIAGALLVLWVAAPLLAARQDARLEAVQREARVDGAVDDVGRRLATELGRAGLQLDVDQRAIVNDERSGARYAQVRLLRAAAESPSDRWRTSWSGPVRRTPQVWATVAEDPRGGTTWVRLQAGLYPPDTAPALEADALLSRVLDALGAPR